MLFDGDLWLCNVCYVNVMVVCLCLVVEVGIVDGFICGVEFM